MHHFEARKRHRQSQIRDGCVSNSPSVIHHTRYSSRSHERPSRHSPSNPQHSSLTHSRCESISQPFNRTLSLERRTSGVEHRPNRVNEVVGVRPQSEERLDGQMLEHAITLLSVTLFKKRRECSSLQAVVIQNRWENWQKGTRLWIDMLQESEICNAGQRARNHRQRQASHTDVDYVALSVDHNISIVPIFDLKDVASDRVRSHRLNEVQSGLLEGDRMFSTKIPPLGNAEVVHYKVAVASHEKARKLHIPKDQSVTVNGPYRANNTAIVEASIYLVQGYELMN